MSYLDKSIPISVTDQIGRTPCLMIINKIFSVFGERENKYILLKYHYEKTFENLITEMRCIRPY